METPYSGYEDSDTTEIYPGPHCFNGLRSGGQVGLGRYRNQEGRAIA